MKNMYVRLLCIFSIMLPSRVYTVFSYDRAIYKAQAGNMPEAKEQLITLLAENPLDAQLLYDTGVASYKTSDYEHAAHYFAQAAEQASGRSALQEQAYFNAGNAYAQQKKWSDAIGAYQQVLAINSTNTRAAHNLQKVEELQKQQQKQDQEKQKNVSSDPKDQSAGTQNHDGHERSDEEKNVQSQKQKKSDDDNLEKDSPKSDSKDSSDSEPDTTQDQKKGDGKEEEHKSTHDKGADHNEPQTYEGGSEMDKDLKKDEQKPGYQEMSDANEHTEQMAQKSDTQTSDAMRPAHNNATYKEGESPAQETQVKNLPIDKAEQWVSHILNRYDEYDKDKTKQFIQKRVGGKSNKVQGW